MREDTADRRKGAGSEGAESSADGFARRRAPDFVIGSDVFDALPEAVVVIDTDRRIVEANAATATLFGWPSGTLIGQDLNVLIPAGLQSEHDDFIRQFVESDRRALDISARGELQGVARDGSDVFVEGTIVKNRRGGRTHLAVILRDVSTRRQAERQLRYALNESLASSRMKSNFLATMSHELRTPLNAIIGFSELLESQPFGALGDPRYLDYVADIRDSGNHLLEVVSSILKAAKLEAERIEVQPRWLHVQAIVNGAVRHVFPILEERRQVVEIDVDDNTELFVDPLLTRQILINLLDNASKFSPAESTIRLVSRRTEEGLAIDVIDRGRGIPEDAMRNLGQPFVQVQAGLARNDSGIGLGLYIVRSYLDLHGGALSISSVEGEGTTMRTCWPADRVRRGGSPLPVDDPRG